MKNLFYIVCAVLCNITYSQATEKWIAIEPFVLDKIPSFELQRLGLKKSGQIRNEVIFKASSTQIDNLSKITHSYLQRCGGFRVLPTDPKNYALNTAVNKSLLQSRFGWYDFQKVIIPNYDINQESLVKSWFNDVSVSEMNKTVEHLVTYPTRFYKTKSGEEALKWIGQNWQSIAKSRSDIDLEYYKHPSHNQPTVILTIKGSDPIFKNEIIILGGHGDSINTDTDDIHAPAPGADDNAAGIAVLTEILRIFVNNNYTPKHTIQFIAYAAEEVGIQGAYELAKYYRENKKPVKGVIQFDGVNFNNKKTFDMALISDSTNEEQNVFLAKLIDKYLKVKWRWEQCGYGCSDHAAWNYEGYRASFPVEAINEEQNPHIHTPQDTFDKSNNTTEHASLFTKLGIAYLIELDQ